MFIPFYFPSKDRLRIVIVGGGYSGLSALATFCEHRRDAEITLIDPRTHHLKITHLHESFRRTLSDFRVPFHTLEKRFGIRHIQAELPCDLEILRLWNHDRTLVVQDEVLEFDYLLWATGVPSQTIRKGEGTLDIQDFSETGGPTLLEERLSSNKTKNHYLTVVGAGATGIQFLFEIAHFLRERRIPCALRLVDSHATPLSQFNPAFGRYVSARLVDYGIDYLPHHDFHEQGKEHVTLMPHDGDETVQLPSEWTLLFSGKSGSFRLDTNAFGQVMVQGTALERVFAAGDVSRYKGLGSNALTAQSAVRKGKVAARNILRHSGAAKVKLLIPYWHQDLGYIISLGPLDAVGWLASERHIVGGMPASVVKEIVEAQYDLLLAGIDTYVL